MHEVRRIASGSRVIVRAACSKTITTILSKVNVISRAEGVTNCTACSIVMHVTSSLATYLHAGIQNAVTVTALSSIRIKGVAVGAANLSINEEEDIAIAKSAACGVINKEVGWATYGKS